MRKTSWLIAGALLATMAGLPPAVASTLPRVDFSQGQTIVSTGLLDVNVDHAVLDQWSVGLSLMPLPSGYAWFDPVLSPLSAAVRSTYRVGAIGNVAMGVTVSAGVFTPLITGGRRPSLNPFPDLPLLRYQYRAFIQPAFNVAWPLGSEEGHWTLRATLGPVLFADWVSHDLVPLWPNIEFSKQLSANSELTILGNGLIGWRGLF